MKGRGRLLLQLTISVGIMVYFVSTIDFREAIRPIPPAGWGYFLLTALLANGDRLMMAFKWNLLLQAKGLRVPFAEVLKSYYFGSFWGIVLPSSVGGDVVRVYRFAALTGAPGLVLSSVLIERVLGLLANLTMVLVGAGLFYWYLRLGTPLLLVGAAAGLVAALSLFVLSLRTSLPLWLEHWLQSRGGKFGTRIRELFTAYQAYRNHSGTLVQFVGLSILEQGFPIVCTILVARGLGLAIEPMVFLIFTPLIMGLSRIPISFDGFGIREGMYVYALGLAGIPAADALVVGFLSHLVGNVSLLPGYVWSLVSSRASGSLAPKPADLEAKS